MLSVVLVMMLLCSVVMVVFVFDDMVMQIMVYVGDYCLVVFGEYYGIVEMLLLVVDLMECYSCDNVVVWLVLELLMSENVVLVCYLCLDGGVDVCDVLCILLFWVVKDDQYDGCCSCDMLDFIDVVCVLCVQGCDVGIVGYDVEIGILKDNQMCDMVMVIYLWQQFSVLFVDVWMLVFIGNVYVLCVCLQGVLVEMQQQLMLV